MGATEPIDSSLAAHVLEFQSNREVKRQKRRESATQSKLNLQTCTSLENPSVKRLDKLCLERFLKPSHTD